MKFFYSVLWMLSVFIVKAQIINAYAKVTAVSSGSVLSISNVNQSNHTFIVGEKVIVMQMQDNVIGTNTTNVSSFGDLAAIGNAGIYEVAVVSAISPTSGVPTSITLSTALANTYNTGANSSVQIITFRNLGANYTTSANINGLAWDGNVGGVIAFEVTNTLTLNNSIVADGIGFVGGAVSTAADETCDNTVYITNSNLKAFKGEGIYKNTNANFTNGRGKILSGGGGGSQNNSGGGGGGNYTAGGDGGLGYQCNSTNSGYGLGGISLSSVISNTRIFMGGGGGGGQQNNNVGTNGGNGGGIILLKANTIVTSTSCGSPITISANGVKALNSGNDGSGGGGAGGSVFIQASNFSVTATCPLTVSANGGAGGSVTDAATHGGGAGAGQGVVFYTIAQPTVNIISTTLNGAGGGSNSSGSPAASGGAGSNNAGIVSGANTILPIELISFTGVLENTGTKLSWSTASERNNDYFSVEKSQDGFNFMTLGNIKGAGNSTLRNDYLFYDREPFAGINYYRLKQTDFNGQFKYAAIITVNDDNRINFSIFPNPVDEDAAITIQLDKSSLGKTMDLSIIDLTGKVLYHNSVQQLSQTEYQLQPGQLMIEKGIYMLKLQSGYTNAVKKLIIR